MKVSRAAVKRTTGVMPDGHGLAGGAGGLAWSGAGAGLGRTLIGGWPVRRWRQRGGTLRMSLFRIYRPVNWEFFRIYPPDFQGHQATLGATSAIIAALWN